MRVLFMMLDGLRPDAISPENTPHIAQFMARGAYTLDAQSVVPPITLPCHASIFHSVPPAVHNVIDNIWTPSPQLPLGLVEYLKIHNLKMGFIYNWEQLRDLNRPGNLHYSFFINTGYEEDGDDIMAQMAITLWPTQTLDCLFLYFSTIDLAGHLYGWMSPNYIRQIVKADVLVGKVLASISDEDTVLIQADHGGHGHNHGDNVKEDMIIPWMIAGPNIKRNYTITSPVSLLDTAPTIARAFNLPPNPAWQGRAVTEAWITA